MTVQRYMQPVAIHRIHAERLLLTDDDNRWFLWMGEADQEPVGIPQGLAAYLLERRELLPLELHQRMVRGGRPARARAGAGGGHRRARLHPLAKFRQRKP